MPFVSDSMKYFLAATPALSNTLAVRDRFVRKSLRNSTTALLARVVNTVISGTLFGWIEARGMAVRAERRLNSALHISQCKIEPHLDSAGVRCALAFVIQTQATTLPIYKVAGLNHRDGRLVSSEVGGSAEVCDSPWLADLLKLRSVIGDDALVAAVQNFALCVDEIDRVAFAVTDFVVKVAPATVAVEEAQI